MRIVEYIIKLKDEASAGIKQIKDSLVDLRKEATATQKAIGKPAKVDKSATKIAINEAKHVLAAKMANMKQEQRIALEAVKAKNKMEAMASKKTIDEAKKVLSVKSAVKIAQMKQEQKLTVEAVKAKNRMDLMSSKASVKSATDETRAKEKLALEGVRANNRINLQNVKDSAKASLQKLRFEENTRVRAERAKERALAKQAKEQQRINARKPLNVAKRAIASGNIGGLLGELGRSNPILGTMRSLGTILTRGLALPFKLIGGLLGVFRDLTVTILGVVNASKAMYRALSKPIKVAGEFEALQLRLNAATGNETAGKAKFKEIQDLSLETPFKLDDLIEAESLLQAIGITGKDALKKISGIAFVFNRDIREVALAIGSLESEVLKRFGIRLRTVGNQFSFTFRAGNKEINKTVEGIQEARKYLVEAFAMKGGFGGKNDLLKKSSQTYVGRIQKIQDQLTILFNKIGVAGLEKFKKILDNIEKTIGRISTKKLEAGLTRLVGILDRVSTKVLGIAEGLLSSDAGEFNIAVDSLKNIGYTIGDAAVDAIRRGIDKYLEPITKVGRNASAGVGGAGVGIGIAASKASVMAGKYSKPLKVIVEDFIKVLQKGKSLDEYLFTATAEKGLFEGAKITEITKQPSKLAKSLGSGASTGLGFVSKGLKLFSKALGWVTAIATALFEAFRQFGDGASLGQAIVGIVVKTAGELILGTIGAVLSLAGEASSALLNLFFGWIPGIKSVSDWLRKLGNTLGDFFSNATEWVMRVTGFRKTEEQKKEEERFGKVDKYLKEKLEREKIKKEAAAKEKERRRLTPSKREALDDTGEYIRKIKKTDSAIDISKFISNELNGVIGFEEIKKVITDLVAEIESAGGDTDKFSEAISKAIIAIEMQKLAIESVTKAQEAQEQAELRKLKATEDYENSMAKQKDLIKSIKEQESFMLNDKQKKQLLIAERNAIVGLGPDAKIPDKGLQVKSLADLVPPEFFDNQKQIERLTNFSETLGNSTDDEFRKANINEEIAKLTNENNAITSDVNKELERIAKFNEIQSKIQDLNKTPTVQAMSIGDVFTRMYGQDYETQIGSSKANPSYIYIVGTDVPQTGGME